MLTTSQLKSVLQAHGLRLSKRLGQHHLIDARVLGNLVQSCELTPHDTVVEIGAGLGALTELLAPRVARLIAVEIDRGVCAVLAERMKRFQNVTVRCEDILAFPWATAEGAVVVGAIPYHVTSPILVALCEQRAHLKAAWLLLQREVARRLLAPPGTKAYGRLSVLCQYGWKLAEVMKVPRQAFFPPPTVDSSWLRLIPACAPPAAGNNEPLLFEIVKAAFGQRRKKLVNGLTHAGLASQAQAETAVVRLGLPMTVRAEALSLEQFVSLAEMLSLLQPL